MGNGLCQINHIIRREYLAKTFSHCEIEVITPCSELPTTVNASDPMVLRYTPLNIAIIGRDVLCHAYLTDAWLKPTHRPKSTAGLFGALDAERPPKTYPPEEVASEQRNRHAQGNAWHVGAREKHVGSPFRKVRLTYPCPA